MVQAVASWVGWKVVARFVPLVAVIAGLVAIWLLVVSPRLEIADLKAQAQQRTIDQLNQDVTLLQAAKKAQNELNKRASEEMDRLAELAAASDRQTIVIRDRIEKAASGAGPQPLGAASRAYFDAVTAELEAEQRK